MQTFDSWAILTGKLLAEEGYKLQHQAQDRYTQMTHNIGPRPHTTACRNKRYSNKRSVERIIGSL